MGEKIIKRICPFCFADCDVRVPLARNDEFPVQYCAKCKVKVPEEIVDSRLFPIAVVGPSGAGKTHYLTVLSHLLCAEKALWPDYWDIERVNRIKEPPPDPSGDIAGIGSNVGGALDDEFLKGEELLYPHKGSRGTILDQTEERSAAEPPLSLVIHISYSKKNFANLLQEPYRKKDWSLLLAFTDTAGEDLQRMSWNSVADKYPILGRKLAEGVIALVNPTQLFAVKEDLKTQSIANAYAQSGVAETVLAPLQDVLSIQEIRKPIKRKPIAVCLAKTEALVKHGKINPEDRIAQPPNIICEGQDDGKIDLTELCDLNDAVSDFMTRMDNGDDKIVGACRNFRYRAFFPTDALGSVIETAQDYGRFRMFSGTPKPRCVIEPLLWILWQHGLVGGKK